MREYRCEIVGKASKGGFVIQAKQKARYYSYRAFGLIKI